MGHGRYHHLSWLHGIEVFEANIRSHSFGRHSHEGFAIGAITAGVGAYRFRGGDVLLPEGSLSLMNPEEVHTGHAASGALRYTMVYISEEAVRALLDLPRLSGFSEIAPQDRDRHLAWRLGHLTDCLRVEGGLDRRLAIEEALNAVLEDSFVRYGGSRLPTPGTERRALSDLRELIAVGVEEGSSLSLATLAAAIGLHPSYLVRSVHRSTGLTPHALVIQRRVGCARDLLLRGMPAAQAASAAGFSDQAHMIRLFRRHYGVTPGALIRH